MMDEGRLGIARRQENFRRKALYVQNDLAKTKWKRLNAHIAKERHDVSAKFDKAKMMVRREIVRHKVLQKCLKMRRNDVQGTRDSMLGYYGGKPLHAFAKDIDQTIAYMHPRLRRLRKVEQQITDSIELGKIVCECEIQQRIQYYFDKHFKEKIPEPETNKNVDKEDKNDIFSRHRNYIPPIRGLVNPFYQFVQEDGTQTSSGGIANEHFLPHEPDVEEIEVKTNQMKIEDEIFEKSKNKNTKTIRTGSELEKKASLILPPINMTRNLVGKNKLK